MDKMDAIEQEKVKDLLRDIQLDQFYRQIHGKLHVTRLSHFEHVTEEDLDDLGMAKPEQRRLFEALKKAKKKSLFSSFRRKKSKKAESQTEAATERTSCYGVAGDALTCLISEQSLTLYELLGNGAFGYVRRGKWVKDSRKKVNVAVKCLKAWNDKAFQQMQMEFIKEANAMSLLDHPHIIRLYGIVLSVPMMLVTELAPLGCLLTRLRDEPHNFTISGLSDFVVQIASGMAYLESQRFVHRDLATRNLLLESYEKVKIGDFGMMRVLSEEDDHYTMHPSGKIPFAWCPHEVLKFRKFSHASDVWAFGITVLELFSYGMEPWPGLNGAEVLDKVDMPSCERPKKPDHCPSEIYSILLLHCWGHEPHQRVRFAVLKKMMDEAHPVNAAAIYPYESKCQESLNFQAGDIVTLLDASPDTSWWKGQNMRTKQVGMFPSELVESGIRRAVSPVSHWTSPKQRSSSKQSSKKCNQLPICDCGKPHIYETPILLDSLELFSASSRGSTSCSSRSVESDFTSSTEVDSGYSSSVDIRRFNLLNGESSPEQQKANFGASYENTIIGVQSTTKTSPTYELMCPALNIASASSPIPIPQVGSREARYVREQRNIVPTPLSEDKCPLDFSNFRDPQLSSGKDVSLPPLPMKNSASLPNTSTVEPFVQAPRLSKTVSPPGSKRSALDSGVGETLVREMLASLKEVGIEKSCDGSSSKPEEEDVYEVLSRPVASHVVPNDLAGHRSSSTSSRDSLKAHSKNAYENHEYDRIKCNSAYQPQSDHCQRDAHCNTWPTQQNYDNHKLKDDTDTTSSSRSCCYDNHNLKTSSELCYDNWKIKNEAYDQDGQLSEETKPQSCYENVELHARVDKMLVNNEEICQESERSLSSNKARTARKSYENCLPRSSYENFTPKRLKDDSAQRDLEKVDKNLYENCEDFDKRKEALTSTHELSRSLPTNCYCVDVVSGNLPHESMSLIVEKRSPLVLTRVKSFDDMEQRNCLTGANKGGPVGDSDGSVESHDPPVPPPRWKHLARLSRTQSLTGCSQERWTMAVNPEIASALKKRSSGTINGTCIDASIEPSTDLQVAKDPQIEVLAPERPALPPRVNEKNLGITKRSNAAGKSYENVELPSKMSSKEVSTDCPPKIPPKKKQSSGSITYASKMSNATTRALHYENVDVVNGFHFTRNGNSASEFENCTPPPLPRKLSQIKVPVEGTLPG